MQDGRLTKSVATQTKQVLSEEADTLVRYSKTLDHSDPFLVFLIERTSKVYKY